MTLTAGSKLGPYEIIAPLGAGGMGEVYRAKDTRLGRDVAVKVLPQHLIENADVRARFEREARTVSSLNHPHICTLHDIGREGETDYLVMELVEGETLADRLQKGPLPTEQVLRIGAEITDALDRAHRAGIVHRDLKPGNIMLSKSGAKLMDFGLARATGIVGGGGGSGASITGLTQSPTVAQPLTAQGSIVGTFQYMAPEQLEGAEADARSDLWALGCVLYEMATGKRAFAGATQASLISSIMKDQPRPISELQELSPPGLDRLVRACLEKDPEERIQTARDVRLHLRWIAEGGSQAGVPAPVAARRRSRERLAWMLVAAASVAAVALAVIHFGFPPPPPQTLRFQVTTPNTVQSQGSPRISPDGRTIAYNATDSTGASRIWVHPLGSLVAQVLPGTEGARRPFWSPDSRFIGFVAGGKMKKISLTGGPPSVICDAATGADGTWGRSGVILFDGGGPDPILRVAASGGIAAPQVSADSAGQVFQVGWPEFLPDGKHFLYLSILPQPTLRVGSLDSKKVVILGPCESQVQYLHTGHLLYSRSGSLVVQPFDARALKFVGEPIPVAEQVGSSAVGSSDFWASDNGVLVYSTRSADTGQLIEVDRSGKQLRLLSCPPEAQWLALSLDGRRIALRVIDPQARTRNIWTIDRTRDLATRFTFEPTNENYPQWSPDGKQIAYWSDAPGAAGITTKQLTGSGETQLLTPVTDEVVLKDWSRDGSTIFYDRPTALGTDIWVLPTTGERKPRPFLNGAYNEFSGRLSPDGRFLAYVSDESGREEVYVQTYPDRNEKWQVSTRGGDDPRWADSGKELFYLSPDQQLMSVPILLQPTFDPGAPQALFNSRVMLPGQQRSHYGVTSDGGTFILFTPASTRTRPTTTVVVNWTAEITKR
ncbi:MAG: protein kinase [Candidatus Eisenbacteria bacterium]